MAVVEFDFGKVSELKGKTSDELIDNLTKEQLEKGNDKLTKMGVISNNE